CGIEHCLVPHYGRRIDPGNRHCHIIVAPGATEEIANVSDYASGGDLRKGAVTQVVIQEVVSLDIDAAIGYEQVRETVVVIIAPGTPNGIADVVREAPGSNLHKRAVTLVGVEKIFGEIGDKQVEEAVVVEISPGTGDGIPTLIDGAARSNLLKVLFPLLWYRALFFPLLSARNRSTYPSLP